MRDLTCNDLGKHCSDRGNNFFMACAKLFFLTFFFIKIQDAFYFLKYFKEYFASVLGIKLNILLKILEYFHFYLLNFDLIMVFLISDNCLFLYELKNILKVIFNEDC